MTEITHHNGQIRRGDQNAEKLYEVVKLPDVHTIVELGTWKGMGSTKCILDGILDSRKKEYEVYSLETNKLFNEQAKINLGLLPPNFHLLHGSIFDVELLKEKKNDPEVHLPWLEEDIVSMKSTKNILDQLPEKIDLVVIDSGEFSGEIEFKILEDRGTYFYLDDISSYKNKNNANYIRNSNEYDILFEDNQTLICKRK